jgi:hypothetical protein
MLQRHPFPAPTLPQRAARETLVRDHRDKVPPEAL